MGNETPPTAEGRSHQERCARQTLTFGFDALSRNLSQSGPLGTTSYQYDLAGRRTRMTWADGFYVTYDHLVTGELTAIRENGAASGVGVLATFGYDDLGRRVSLTRGNGTVTSYGYDAVSRLETLTQSLTGTASDITATFAHNPASQITSAVRSNDAYAWTGHYNVNRGYGVNGLNQLTSSGSLTLAYDGRGNLTSDGSATFGYSAENLLTSAPGASLAYDPLMRLYETDGAVTTRRLPHWQARLHWRKSGSAVTTDGGGRVGRSRQRVTLHE